MTDSTQHDIDVAAVFEHARELSGEERHQYLNEACEGNTEFQAEVEDMLKVAEQQGEFLADPTIDLEPSTGLGPGTRIGPYKLLQQIGEGGFGIVFMAEQREPVQRKVAVKVIKPGMDTREVIARFEAEQQALAIMEHANIARVFDAGTTDNGRPYFVMELIKGVPITEYCDQNSLATEDRLKLFQTVCAAVQHAHQKGIIHRDLKPSNVLITLHDGQPVVKVIDFGISKALNQQLTERTLFTRFGQMVGTPQYMSPEQAEMSGLDIDTRSDIYSLGVLLYELLTGKPPFDAKTLREAGFDEMRRLIRETEPPKPSTRFGSLDNDSMTDIAKHRRVQPRALCKLVSGDLDWIVMKSLEKDRNLRYASANELAADVQHHLDDEAVTAGPPGFVYRCRKLVRKHRALLATAAVVLIAIAVGTCTSIWQAVRVTRANHKIAAVQEELLEYVERLAQSYIDGDQLDKADLVVRRLLQQREALLGKDDPRTLRSSLMLGELLSKKQSLEEALPILSHVYNRELRKGTEQDDDVVRAKNALESVLIGLAWSVLYQQPPDFNRAIVLSKRYIDLAESDEGLAAAFLALSYAQSRTGDPVGSLASLQRSVGHSSQFTKHQWPMFALLEARRGNVEVARDWYYASQHVMGTTQVVDDELQDYATRNAREILNDSVEADPPDSSGTIEIFGRLIERYPKNGFLHLVLGNHYARLGKWENALAHCRTAARIEPTGKVWQNLGIFSLYSEHFYEYQTTCSAWFEATESSRDSGSMDIWSAAGLVQNCALAPGSATDLEELWSTAESIYENRRGGAQALAIGMLAYRMERFEKALATLPAKYSCFSPACQAVRAMAFHQLGNHVLAKQSLMTAESEADRLLKGPDDVEDLRDPYNAARVWCFNQILLREARRVVGDDRDSVVDVNQRVD